MPWKATGPGASALLFSRWTWTPITKLARAGAGFRKDRNGDWVLKEKVMGEERGKVLQGRIWVFPEEVVVTRAREAAAAELAPIRKRMNTLHTAIAFGRSEKMRRESIAKIQRIQDPREANIMAEYLLDQRRKATSCSSNVRQHPVSFSQRYSCTDQCQSQLQAANCPVSCTRRFAVDGRSQRGTNLS